jgi:hypothetical protein
MKMNIDFDARYEKMENETTAPSDRDLHIRYRMALESIITISAGCSENAMNMQEIAKQSMNFDVKKK